MSIPALARTMLMASAPVVALLLWAHGPAGAGASPAVALIGPSAPILPGDTFAVTVTGTDLPPLGAYEVVVSYDDLYLEFLAGSDSGFLGSTGRNVSCFPPIVTSSVARFGCATIGSGAGPKGDGTLATLYFKAFDPGQTAIALREAGLADEFGNNAGPANLRGASITIERAGGEAEPKPTETATPASTKPEATATVGFVPPVETPTAPAGAPTNTAVATATNTRVASTATPAPGAPTTPAGAAGAAGAATDTPPSGSIAGSAPKSSASDVLGSSRAPAGIGLPETGSGLPETGSGGGASEHQPWLLLIAAVSLLVLALPLLVRRR